MSVASPRPASQLTPQALLASLPALRLMARQHLWLAARGQLKPNLQPTPNPNTEPSPTPDRPDRPQPKPTTQTETETQAEAEAGAGLQLKAIPRLEASQKGAARPEANANLCTCAQLTSACLLVLAS